MSSSSLRRRYGSSTAQANLTKIITIIVTVPPLPSSPNADTNDISATPPEAEAPVNLDLRLGLTLDLSPTAPREEEGIPPAHSSVIDCPNQAESVNKPFKNPPSAIDSVSEADASSEGECSPIKHREREISEITNTSCKEEEEINGEGYLDLLLEAARRVSGDGGGDAYDEKRSSPPALRSKRRKTSSPEAVAEVVAAPPPAVVFSAYEETEPIVRSRRGRNQTLPLRYRDSVLEPWRKPPTVFRR